MAHTHPVIDGDNHFIIDAITRAVTNAESKKTILMQNDHNSEQFTFEINKLVEGHDMTLCNKVEVHYINEDSNKKNKNVGVYEVTDMRESEEDPDRLIFSWLVSENATLYAGSLRFLIVFSCIEKGDVTYRWNTNVNASISIAKGMNNGEAIEEAYPDVLTQWKSELFAALYGMETTYVGPHEPETYPYIWFDTSEYLDQTDPYVGVIKVKDSQGRLWPIYPFTKLVATDGVGLDVVLENILKTITELENTKLEEEDVEELIKDKVTANDVNEMIKDKVDAEDVNEMIKDKVEADDVNQLIDAKLEEFDPGESQLPEGILTDTDIANDLITNDASKVLSAAQGVVLNESIEALEKAIDDLPDTSTPTSPYNVGDIYITTNSTSPASVFGGTWEQIKDRFLLAAGTSYTAGKTGGSATHTLTVNELPSHYHDFSVKTTSGGTALGLWDSYFTSSSDVDQIYDSSQNVKANTYGTKSTGGGAAHNNMPPYLTVYIWKRVA